MLYVLRVSLPDIPGSLGAAATALSAAGANIVSLRVIDRDGRHAFDEICVEAESVLPEDIRNAIESAPGVVVETIRRTSRIPDPLGALTLADRLARGEGPPMDVFVGGLPEALSASWAMVLEAKDRGLVVGSSTPDAPAPGVLEAPWLPLIGARRIEMTDRMPPGWRLHRYELAAAPLDEPERFVLVGRPTGMRFIGSELRQLELTADMTDRAQMRAVGNPV
ncbi:MAG: ACT domain-containing protein [Actinomycetota bacterium]